MLNAVLSVMIAVLALSTGFLVRYVVRMRAEKHGRGLFHSWPVPQVDLVAFGARFETSALGPNLDTEIAFIGAYRVPGAISDFETWILANLAKDAEAIFEFGTCTGKTSYLLAKNAPAQATVVTLTLKAEQLGDYRSEHGDESMAACTAFEETLSDRFYYSGTNIEPKIRQLFGDSKAFDETPYLGRCDLIFIDGSHAYSYVKSDSEKALRMVRSGGLILWHDYRGPRRSKGVFQALNELKENHALVRIKDTSLVAYRHPA